MPGLIPTFLMVTTRFTKNTTDTGIINGTMKSLGSVLPLFLSLVSLANAVPSGFIDEGVANVEAITGAFAPNPQNGMPMLIVSSKEGLIHVIPDPDNSDEAILVADFTSITCSNGERGLQTILPHPNFFNNRYIFAYYTRFIANCPESATNGPSNRLSRFTMDKDTFQIDLNSEVVLMTGAPAVRIFHNGGSMAIGKDGFLYITTGDVGSREPPYAQSLSNLQGKMLRLDLTGNAPPTNPFSKASNGVGVNCRNNKGFVPANSPKNATCEEIYAYGLRNPFRMAMDPNTNKVRYIIGDVGGSYWEEINDGGEDYIGTNYQWPTYEGPCERDSINKCNRNAVGQPGTTSPFYYYQHTQESRGGAITGSVIVPTGLWPAKYQYLFLDYIYDEMYSLIPDKSFACPTCTPPRPAFRNETFHRQNSMVDLFFGPYKNTRALYLVSRAEGQNIRRIRYTGSDNRAPTADIAVEQTKVLRGEVLVFDGTGSSDPDGDTLTYLWDFGDGTMSKAAKVSKIYPEFGQYEVTLTVTDSLDQKSQTFVTIVVGTIPVAFIESPAFGKKFVVGEVVRLKGNATDSKGNPIPDDRIFWEVRQHHATHFHPFLDKRSGNDFDLFAAPAPEELAAADNSYLEVIMSSVDASGITRTITRRLGPRKIFVNITSSPSGLEVLVNENPITTPGTILTWQNQVIRLDVKNQRGYVFDSWNILGFREREYVIKAPNGARRNITAFMKKL